MTDQAPQRCPCGAGYNEPHVDRGPGFTHNVVPPSASESAKCPHGGGDPEVGPISACPFCNPESKNYVFCKKCNSICLVKGYSDEMGPLGFKPIWYCPVCEPVPVAESADGLREHRGDCMSNGTAEGCDCYKLDEEDAYRTNAKLAPVAESKTEPTPDPDKALWWAWQNPKGKWFVIKEGVEESWAVLDEQHGNALAERFDEYERAGSQLPKVVENLKAKIAMVDELLRDTEKHAEFYFMHQDPKVLQAELEAEGVDVEGAKKRIWEMLQKARTKP